MEYIRNVAAFVTAYWMNQEPMFCWVRLQSGNRKRIADRRL